MAQNVDLTLDQIERSKVYVSKIDTFTFKEPQFYLEPFMDKFKGLDIDWRFRGEIGSVNKDKEIEFEEGTGEENIAYSSLIARAKMPSAFDYLVDDPMFNKLFTEIGFTYNFEGQKPHLRLYRGSRVSICDNGVIFGVDNIMTIALTGGKQSLADAYDRTSKYIDTAMDMIKRYERTIEKLTSTVRDTEASINEKFGQMVRLGISNKVLGINPITGAINSMLDKKSKYAIQDSSITDWKIFNSVTEELKKASLVSESAKVLLLEELFVN